MGFFRDLFVSGYHAGTRPTLKVRVLLTLSPLLEMWLTLMQAMCLMANGVVGMVGCQA